MPSPSPDPAAVVGQHAITSISVTRMWESCERTSYYVTLTNDEGFDMTPNCHQTGSVYNNHQGLSIDEARDRALIDAHNWSDFLGIPVRPYVENGETFEPSTKFNFYDNRRVLSGRKEVRAAAATLTEAQKGLLLVMEGDRESDTPYRSFADLGRMVGKPRSVAGDIARYLRAIGLAQHQSGLVTDDGDFYGSGYCLTPLGLAVKQHLQQSEEQDHASNG